MGDFCHSVLAQSRIIPKKQDPRLLREVGDLRLVILTNQSHNSKGCVIIAEIGLITKHQLDFDLFDEFAVMHRLIRKLLILVVPEIL